MAVRALILALALAVCGLTGPADACFGPKLYVGLVPQEHSEVMFALVTLYVQEKTGVESLRVELEPTQNPRAELAADRLDLALVATPAGTGDRDLVLAVGDYPGVASGVRPREDLQFTTVLPAIRKLAGLLSPAELDGLVAEVATGTSPLAAARSFLRERRWI